MRHRRRIQPYVSKDVHQKLRAHCAAHGVTESAVAEAALAAYLEPDASEREAFARRLDRTTHGVEEVQHDVAILSNAFAEFVRFWMMVAMPPEPADPAAARRLADEVFQRYLRHVARKHRSGVRLAGDVTRVALDLPPPGHHKTSGTPPSG